MIMEYGSRVLLAVITLAIGWWLINKVTRKLGGLLALRNADLALQGFISNLANIILKILLIVSVASMIGIETTSFIAAIGDRKSTSELQSLMRISYAVFCLKKKTK